MSPAPASTVVKLGGELLEPGETLAPLARAIATLASATPVVVVHGGGREIDAEAARRGLVKQAVDGLRVTDAATLDAVVAVLAGVVNTRLVAALVAAGVRAVGLTGADAALVPVGKAPLHRGTDGRLVDLGFVGEPVASTPALAFDLVEAGYVPVIASIGVDPESGDLYNVNADTLAAHVAAAAGAARLVIAGATAGVLDGHGHVIATLDRDAIAGLIADGTASAGMIAKLAASLRALEGGVAEIVVASGRVWATRGVISGTRIVGHAVTAGERA